MENSIYNNSQGWETIYGQIVGKANNYQAVPDGQGGKRIIKNEAIRQYERMFCRACKIYKGRNIDSRFKLEVHIYNRSSRFDLDNGLKTLCDCLQYVGAIKDDNLCECIEAHKHTDPMRPRVTFRLTETQPRML